jgi:chemotaxis signal transduction protein
MRTTLFGVGEVEYAVIGRVPRILPATRPLPERIDHAGAAFPVLDLPALLGGGEAAAGGGAESLLLLVEEASGDAEAGGHDGEPGGPGFTGQAVRRALVVERLSGTEELDPTAVQPVPAVYPERERRRWRGLLPRPDGRVAVLLDLSGLDGVPDGGEA